MSAVRQLLLLSSSNLFGYGYLEYAAADITNFFKKNNVTTVLFIPYALNTHDSYLNKVRDVFSKWGFEVDGIHKSEDPVKAVMDAQAIFIGGGNTFMLLKALYENELIDVIHKRVMLDGVPYMGSSAGTNVSTKSINTTNDMPIVYPPSFNALNLVPFNINPHYQDTDPESKHKGETREERILQFQELPEAGPVLALREGCHLCVSGNSAVLKGINGARLFIPGKEPKEFEVGSDFSFLLNESR